MHHFTVACNGNEVGVLPMMPTTDKEMLVSGGTSFPKLLTGHVVEQQSLTNLVRTATDETLIIYNYQSETDRLASGIKYVVKNRYCGDLPIKPEYLEDGISTKEECVVNERNMLNMIKNRVDEIRAGNHDLLTCHTFDVIEENKPNFVLYDMHYLDKLQSAFAKKYCPELEGKSFHKNEDSSKRKVMVRVDEQESGTDPTVPDITIDEWVDNRKHLLEWSFDLYKGASCRGKMREYAKELSTCVEDGGVGIVLSSVP